jgi:hypothetical protein
VVGDDDEGGGLKEEKRSEDQVVQKLENARVQKEQSYIPEIRGDKLLGLGKREVTSGACESENKRIMRDDDERDTGLEQY